MGIMDAWPTPPSQPTSRAIEVAMARPESDLPRRSGRSQLGYESGGPPDADGLSRRSGSRSTWPALETAWTLPQVTPGGLNLEGV